MIVNRGCSNRCAVRRCYSNYQKYNGDLHLFRFPKDINRCQEWARKCGILDNYQGNLNALYTSVYRVCSLHFEEKMFKGKLKKRLIETALPTLQLNYSHHDDNNISINTITSMPDEHSTVNELEAVILKPCQMDAMDASPTEPVMKQDCEEPTEPRIKVEHLMITPPDIKQKAKFNHTEDNVSETDIDIKDDIVGSVGNVKQELREFHLCEVCDATFGTALEVEDHKIKNFRCQHQEADIKEQPQHGMDNIIYVCSTCNKIYEGKEELINHKNEISSCHEHKICEKCGSDFTCTLELEFHMKTIHIVKDQGLKLELKEHQIEDPEYLKKFDIKEEPQDEMDNIYVCSICDEMYKSKDELIYHKEEKAGCHEHKTCDKCESNFTCTWELEDHLKTVHGLKNQDDLPKYEIQDLQSQINEEDSDSKKKSYPCRFCPKMLKGSHLRTRHERLHTGEKPYQCLVCGKSFSSTSNLHDHEAIHSGEKRFSCSFCDKMFICNTNKKRHEQIHMNEKSFQCQFCDQFFSSRVSLKEHKETHSETPYVCQFCPRSFRSSFNRSRHEKVHSGNETVVMKKVRHSFLSTELIFQKEETKDAAQKLKFVVCDVCLKSFPCDAKLQEHKRIHTGEKPFACRFCDKSFTTNSILKKHEDIHSGEKPFSCSFCLKSFISNFKRIQHERIHTGEKPYLCRYCDKSFSTFSIATDHEKTHTGERPHTCHICNKTFTRKSSLQTHERVHTGEKPCTCNTCGKVFTYVSSLRKHERVHKDDTEQKLVVRVGSSDECNFNLNS